MLDPVGRRNGWPIGKPDEVAWVEAVPLARPAPLPGSTDEVRAERIPFDVSADLEKMRVIGERKGLEPSLIERAGAQGTMGMVPFHRMGHPQPVHEHRKIPVGLRPEHEQKSLPSLFFCEQLFSRSLDNGAASTELQNRERRRNRASPMGCFRKTTPSAIFQSAKTP